MKITTQAFAIHIPDANGESTERIVSIDVPVSWDEMIDEWVLTEEAHEMIDRRKILEIRPSGNHESTGWRTRIKD